MEKIADLREGIAAVASACECLADYLNAVGRALDLGRPDILCSDQVARCAYRAQQLADICFQAVAICDEIASGHKP